MNAEMRRLIAQHLKLGDKAEAQSVLADFLHQYPHDEEAWLAMAGLVQDPAQRRDCLARVLSINPKNKSARQLLARLSAGPDSADSAPEDAGPSMGLKRPRLQRRARRK